MAKHLRSPASLARLALPLVILFVPLLSLVDGCASAVGAIVGSVTVYCSVTTGGKESSCVASRNFPSSQQGTLESDCTKNGGTVALSCPTSGVVGCCTQNQSAAGVTVEIETCSYAGTASALKAQCSGTWSTTP
jgi:hypothetical protein